MTGLWLWACLSALAQAPEPPEQRAWGPAAAPTEMPDAPQLSERPVPDYDGREDAPPSLGESLLWVPRVALAPAYALHRYVIYPPVRAGVITFERDGIAKKVERALTIGDPEGGRALLVPTALFDFGFRPSVGLVLLGSDIGPNQRSSFAVGAAWGGNNWVSVHGDWEQDLSSRPRDEGSKVFASALYLKRPDEVFGGLGKQSPVEDTRFTQLRAGLRGGADVYVGLYDHIRVSAGYQTNEFEPSRDGIQGDPSITALIDPDQLPGFTDGYGLLDVTVQGVADSRVRRPAPGSGASADFEITLGTDMTGDTSSFVRLSGGLSAYWDVTGHNRTLMIRQWAGTVSDLGGTRDVAFTELINMGGVERHRGFLRESLRGGSGLLTTFEYTWPVWVMCDANVFAEFGGVYAPHFNDFELASTRASFGMGITAKERKLPLRAQLGVGTTPLGQRPGLDNIRFTFGTTGIR